MQREILSVDVVIEWSVRELKNKMAHLFENHCESGLYTMKFHLLDPICGSLERFCSIQFLDAALHEHFNIVLETLYRTTFMMRETVVQEMASALKATVNGLKREEI